MTPKEIILDALNTLESAPSALCLIESISSDVSEERAEEIYNMAEADCDAEVKKRVESISTGEMVTLFGELLKTALERIKNQEEAS